MGTSVGVVIGVGAVAATGWLWLDPVIALPSPPTSWDRLAADQSLGLRPDGRCPAPEEQAAVVAILDRYRADGIDYHALRTAPGPAASSPSTSWSPVAGAFSAGTTCRAGWSRDPPDGAACAALTHLEPIEDPVSAHDIDLDRQTHPTDAG